MFEPIESDVYSEITEILYDIVYDENITFVDEDEENLFEIEREEEAPFIDFPTTDDEAQA